MKKPEEKETFPLTLSGAYRLKYRAMKEIGLDKKEIAVEAMKDYLFLKRQQSISLKILVLASLITLAFLILLWS